MPAQKTLLFLLLTCAITNLQAASASSAMVASAPAVAAAAQAPVHECDSRIPPAQFMAALDTAINSKKDPLLKDEPQNMLPQLLQLIAQYVGSCKQAVIERSWNIDKPLSSRALLLKRREGNKTEFARFDLEQAKITGSCHVPTPYYDNRLKVDLSHLVGAFLLPHRTANGSHAIIVYDGTTMFEKHAQQFEISSDFKIGQPKPYPYATHPERIHCSGNFVINDDAIVDVRTSPWPRHPLPASIGGSLLYFSANGHWLVGQIFEEDKYYFTDRKLRDIRDVTTHKVVIYPFDQNNPANISTAKKRTIVYPPYSSNNSFVIAPDGSRCILTSVTNVSRISCCHTDAITGEFKESFSAKDNMRNPQFCPYAEVICAYRKFKDDLQLFSALNGQPLVTLPGPVFADHNVRLVGYYVVYETYIGNDKTNTAKKNIKLEVHYVGDVYAAAARNHRQMRRNAHLKAQSNWKKLKAGCKRLKLTVTPASIVALIGPRLPKNLDKKIS